MHFEESGDPDKPFTAVKIGSSVYFPRFKGRAWIAKNSYDVLRIETDLVAPISKIDLQLEHIVIHYAPVQFREHRIQLWLPQRAQVDVSYRGHNSERVHNFTQFELFSVDTAQAVKEPVANDSTTEH